MSSRAYLDGFLRPEKDEPVAQDFLSQEYSAPSGHEASENSIWLDFLQGSENALSKLFERYSHKLFNYGKQFTHDTGLINDAIQDVFYQLVRNKHKLGIAQSVKHYLFSCFRRRLLRLLKQHKKLVLDENCGLSGRFQLSVTPDYHWINTKFTIDQKQLLENACNQLPVRQREILALYFFEGLSYAEIADVMEFSQVKSARKLLYRSLDGLSTLLEKHRDILRIFYLFIG
ncbi:RNA polymerase sigma-70 factor (ECF subfamily) [Algoriphagus sp. 4150]|uniref:RNA polymerase sigma factor n=1 Tax=Algoriphagus sp. 4150 TaxID=2817756 RepID=UPI0028658538|nr:sigma-70 family RNA polymerase sigma factor [Algoriphagus sp. 4150]MDR7130298.1 RNA polymerase sigma-70 factor (ECF subfamily) [Algoriphagus sp. 4150]